jgi:hypothetical protein
LLQSRYESLENLDAVFIRPVMQNPTKEIYVSTVYGLFLEKVMRHEVDIQIAIRFGVIDNFWKFLDNQVEVGVFPS